MGVSSGASRKAEAFLVESFVFTARCRTKLINYIHLIIVGTFLTLI
jgi:hypothetical protein